MSRARRMPTTRRSMTAPPFSGTILHLPRGGRWWARNVAPPSGVGHEHPQHEAEELLCNRVCIHGAPTSRAPPKEFRSHPKEINQLASERCPVPFFTVPFFKTGNEDGLYSHSLS